MSNDLVPSSPAGVPRLEVAPGVYAPDGALRVQFSRSSGPGGQNVNKVNTKAEAWLAVGPLVGLDDHAKQRLRLLAGKRLTQGDEIHVVAETSRSQESNRLDAMQRLREMILQAQVRPKHRRKTRPTQGSRRRRLEGKKRRSEIKANRRAV